MNDTNIYDMIMFFNFAPHTLYFLQFRSLDLFTTLEVRIFMRFTN